MNNFYDQYREIEPYLQRKEDKAIGKEQIHQSVDDRKKLVSTLANLLSKFDH